MRCVLRRVLGVCGLCRGCVQGVVGRVRCVWGVYVVCACGAFVGCVLGRVWRGGGAVVERKYRSPLYYPDTLVNLDTCLGVLGLGPLADEHEISLNCGASQRFLPF